ncbi:MAG TPA: hypothetical protein VFA81_08450 [Burkholderiales bacterium]|nr:hypothetical protein [Burkholderiales bacterium]
MAQGKHAESTWKAPIVEEVRAARQELFAACEYDLDKLVARLREGELQHSRPSVSYSKRVQSEEPAQ